MPSNAQCRAEKHTTNAKDHKHKTTQNATNGYLIAQNGIKMEKGFSQGTIYIFFET